MHLYVAHHILLEFLLSISNMLFRTLSSYKDKLGEEVVYEVHIIIFSWFIFICPHILMLLKFTAFLYNLFSMHFRKLIFQLWSNLVPLSFSELFFVYSCA